MIILYPKIVQRKPLASQCLFLSSLCGFPRHRRSGTRQAVFCLCPYLLSWYHRHGKRLLQITKKGDSSVRSLLQCSETYAIAEWFDRVEYAVSSWICLNKTVHFQVLIHPQSIERSCIKARQEHIDYDQQVKLLISPWIFRLFLVMLLVMFIPLLVLCNSTITTVVIIEICTNIQDLIEKERILWYNIINCIILRQ